MALGPGEGAGRVPSALGVILSKPSWVGRSANLEEFPPGDATTSGGSPDTLFVVGIPRGGGAETPGTYLDARNGKSVSSQSPLLCPVAEREQRAPREGGEG